MEHLSITFPVDLRKQLDAEAKRESMGRSTLIQKAVRVYLQLKKQNETNSLLAQAYDELNDEARELMTDFSTLDNESLKHVR
jgi:metal-responsive CopG/Arc/MetJ family transcriptional regulator